MVWSASGVSAHRAVQDGAEAWRITVVGLEQTPFIEGSFTRVTANDWYIIQIVHFEVENSGDVGDTLHIDLDSLVVADAAGISYVSVGLGTSKEGWPFVHTQSITVSGTLYPRYWMREDGTLVGSLTMDTSRRYLGIFLEEHSSAPMKLAFPIPVELTKPVLSWPGMQPVALDEALLPAELVPLGNGDCVTPRTWGQLKAVYQK